MQMLTDGLVLYHGSYMVVSEPDIAKCAKYKDFGQGFYLTTSFDQAKWFAQLTLRKAKANRLVDEDQVEGFVSRFLYREAGAPLDVRSFLSADAAWLHCVVAHRRQGLFEEVLREFDGCDVVIGKVANDQTNATITNYMAEAFGPLGSQQADQICTALLLPERLTDQLCFRTPAALQHLEFVGADAV